MGLLKLYGGMKSSALMVMVVFMGQRHKFVWEFWVFGRRTSFMRLGKRCEIVSRWIILNFSLFFLEKRSLSKFTSHLSYSSPFSERLSTFTLSEAPTNRFKNHLMVCQTIKSSNEFCRILNVMLSLTLQYILQARFLK